MLTINKTMENGAARFALGGRLDTTTAPELDQELKDGIFDRYANIMKQGTHDALAEFFRCGL